MSSILFRDSVVPKKEYDSILLLGIVSYIQKIVLRGANDKKLYSQKNTYY